MIHAAAPPEIAFGVTKICNSILANRNALPKLADHRHRQQGAGRMLYIVEIEANGDDLISQMNRFREWLDHMRYEPIGFRRSSRADRPACRVDFENQIEANAFAQAFGGRLLSASPA
jgi:hypothetical protein